MRRSSFWNDSTLKRQNRGKPSAEQLDYRETRTRFQHSVSALQVQWANEDAAEQTTRTADTEQMKNMNTDTKSKLVRLAYRAVRKDFFGDFTKFPAALAKVIGKHPAEFSNCREAVLAEFQNEEAAMPTSLSIKAEVAREQKASGLDYDTSFRVVAERCPTLARRTTIQNEEIAEELADSRKAGAELLEAVNVYFNNHPGMDRTKQADYQYVWNHVYKLNPEITSRLHRPGRPAANLWLPGASDGKTPARTPDKAFQTTGKTPVKEGKNYGSLGADNPAQRAAKISRAVHA